MKLLPSWTALLAVMTALVIEVGTRMAYSAPTEPRRLPAADIQPPPEPTPRQSGATSSELYEITAYSHGCAMYPPGQEPIAARTASGLWPIVNETVAADPSLGFGREVLIEGLGYWTVHDRGSAIKGRKLDLFVNTCREAREFGRQWRHVYIVPEETTREAEKK